MKEKVKKLEQITSLKQLVDVVTWKQLILFFSSASIYFVLLAYGFFGSQLLSTITKCLPICCLMNFVFFFNKSKPNNEKYQKHILISLLFSMAGDALLDFRDGELFPLGMLAFAVAQVSYIFAFRFKNLMIVMGLIIYGLGLFSISFLYQNFDEILIFGVPIYSFLLLTMMWRALARSFNDTSLPRKLCALGAISFVLSDGIIAFDKFYSPIQYSRILIMLTYYLAQLGITISVVDNKPKKSSKKD